MTIKLLNDKHSNLFQMPGGEWHISSLVPLVGNRFALVQGALPNDLMALAIWADAVHRDGGTPNLLIPYLPGARQDRRQTGEALSSKVYADMINSMQFGIVVCVDPHSDVMPALIDRLLIIPQEEILSEFRWNMAIDTYTGIIAPDAGASKKAFKVGQELQIPVIQALKHRDMTTGKLSGFSLCEKIDGDGRYLIIDDICDGGGTFMGLASAMRLPPAQLSLFVTHGIFSGDNAENLHRFFNTIFTTNSHQGCTTPWYNPLFEAVVVKYDITDMMLQAVNDEYCDRSIKC